MKKIFLLLLVGIFMMSFSSALNLTDNISYYYNLDEETGNFLDSLSNLDLVEQGTVPNGGPGIIITSRGNYTAGNYANGSSSEFSVGGRLPHTINMWINSQPTGGDEQWLWSLSNDVEVSDYTNHVERLENGTILASGSVRGATVVAVQGGTIVDGVWSMITVIVHPDGFETLCVNNVCTNSSGAYDPNGRNDTQRISLGTDWPGTFRPSTHTNLDEVGFWNRSLTLDEVNDLYNSAQGLTYPFIPNPITVLLDAPVNNSLESGNVTFNASLIASFGTGFNLTNATLFVWDSGGNLFNSQTNIVLGQGTNTTSFIVENLTSGNYQWNVLGFSENATDDASAFALLNNSFTWIPFEVDNEVFNLNVFETSRQDFLINITTIASILSVDAILNYNGSRFTSQVSCAGGLCQIETAIDIPLVTAGESENKTFFWEITVFDGTISFTSNTSANEQNVTRLHLEQCDGTFTVQTLNFTAFNEATLVPVNPFTFGGTFNFWTGTGTIKRENSIEVASSASVQLCLLPANEIFRLDGTVAYDEVNGTNFTSRNYFFGNNSISSTSQDIGLGLLNADDSTSFILKVQNSDILPQPNVIILTQRFYPGEGIFRTVQVSQTDDTGATVGFFKTETVDYRFILTLDGETVLITNKQKIVGEDVPFTLTFTIGEDQGAAWADFEDADDLDSAIIFNKTSSIVSFTYLDTSGNFTSSRFIVEKINASALQNNVICDVTSIQSSATLTCNLTGNITGQYTSRGIITRDGESFLAEQFNFLIETFSQVAGNLGLFLGWFVILICAFLFKFNEIAGIIMINLSVIFVNLIGLIAFGYVFISAMLAISIIILVVLER